MDTQNLKQRHSGDSVTATNIDTTVNDGGERRKRDRKTIAKRGLRSLAVAVSVPLSLTFLTTFLCSGNAYRTNSKPPFWFPPLWALHFTCLVSSVLMGLSAWLVWVEGGFHRKPTALYLYLVNLVLSLIWSPIVFGAGGTKVGLIVCLGMLGAVLGCSKMFKEVKPIAGDLLKPCVLWTAILALVNLKLIYL
ncbi:hypothetical protein UlMin_031235 [Ulmus minor]